MYISLWFENDLLNRVLLLESLSKIGLAGRCSGAQTGMRVLFSFNDHCSKAGGQHMNVPKMTSNSIHGGMVGAGIVFREQKLHDIEAISLIFG